MSRLIATHADEMLKGTNSGVMGTYYATDGEVPGTVQLVATSGGTTNYAPNPDLTDVDARGRLRGWEQNAPPSPDSWNVYIRQISTRSGATDTLIKPPNSMLRQNESPMRMTEHTYQQDYPLLTAKSLPNIQIDRSSDLAAPIDAPRAEAVTTSGAVGFPAGTYFYSYCGIIGNHPIESSRLTACAPIPTTGITVTAGQVIEFQAPQEMPASWTGIAFLLGTTTGNLRVQKRVDIRGKILSTVTDRGPYRRDGRTVDTTTNNTLMGSFKEFIQPKAWQAHSGLNLDKGVYELSYRLVTKQGHTASQTVNTVSITNDQPGTALAWVPPQGAVQQEGVIGWIPEFRGHDGNWYTKEDATGDGYHLNQECRIWTKRTDKDNWKGHRRPVKFPRQEVDRSGVPNPTDQMEPPVGKGAAQMTAGRYLVRVTNANQKENMESAPSPGTIVTLTDAGSGLTSQSIRVYRPHPQTLRNSRLVETDPVTGATTLHWETFSPTGISVTDGPFFDTISYTDATNTGSAVNLRRSSIEPIVYSRYYMLRFRMNVTSYAAGNHGTIRVGVRFLQADKTTVNGTQTLEDFRGTQDTTNRYMLGPALSGNASFDIPSGTVGTATETKYIQAYIQGVGATSDTPAFTFAMSNIGMFVGRSAPKKVYDLTLGQNTPHKDVWPVPDEQADTTASPTTATWPYPAGPYVRTVMSPNDPARGRNVGYIERKGFEDNSVTTSGAGNTGTWATGGTNGTFTIATSAIRGLYSAVSNVTSTATAPWGGYITKNFLLGGRTTFAVEASFRIKTMFAGTGTASLLGVTRDAGSVNYLMSALVTGSGGTAGTAGQLQLNYYTGAAMSTITVPGITVQQGDDIRIELRATGMGGASGQAFLTVRKNDRIPVTVNNATANLTWGTTNANNVMLGWQNGTAFSTSTARALVDRITVTTGGVGETTNIPGSLAQYWAPEGQPAHRQDHFITGLRWPVKAGQQRTFSCYMRYQGVTTPADGANLFQLTSFDKDGNPLENHGWVATTLLGRDHWDRYSLTYTTSQASTGDPGDAAYVQITRNEIGDGMIEVMGIQDETTAAPTAFTNVVATTGSFQVVFDTTIPGGPLTGFVNVLNRMFAVATTYGTTSTVTVTARGGNTNPPTGTFGALGSVSASSRYVELKCDLVLGNGTQSPEVRALILDVLRPQPMLLTQDGRDFDGGAVVYQLTPSSPRPNVVRKEYADGSVGVEYVGRHAPPKVLKLSVEAFTDLGKLQIERNPATDEPYYQVETANRRYTIAMVPELSGNQAEALDGTYYWDYTAEGLEADVIEEDAI